MEGPDYFRYSALAALGLCWVTIILGGNVIATGSGLGCPDWPSCTGGWNLFPSLSGAMGVEWTHRVAAFFLSVSIVLLTAFAFAYERSRPAFVRLSLAALVLVVVLALLGGAVVDSYLDIALVLLHFGVATVLFGVLLVVALLANWKKIPRRWKEWAQRASEPGPYGAAAPSSSPGSGGADPGQRPVATEPPGWANS